MALSTKEKEVLAVALANAAIAEQIASAIAAGENSQAATVAAIATADATDLASAIALANANKAKVNAILVALKAAGLMA